MIWLKNNGGALVRDAIGIAGMSLLVYGAWLVAPASGYLVAGVILCFVAWRLARDA